MNFNEEQQKIIDHINSILKTHSGGGWGHFQGDVIPRILADYVKRHLPKNRIIVGPNVYIKDVPTEFDLMIVDSDSNPIHFTSAYEGENIRCVIEVKRKGIFGNKADFEKNAQRIKENFDKATGNKLGLVPRVNCKAAYITVSETVNPKKEESNKYWDITKRCLTPYGYGAFVLQDSRGNKIQNGEWQRFIEYVASDE
jgi:hypothetical protein